MNFILPYGAAMALMNFRPPAASAGKNLTTSRPFSIARSMSDGLEQPGVIGMLRFWQYCTTFSLKPGLTMKRAPASMARSTCSVVMTVPAPTSMSGTFLAMLRIDSSAFAVRNVISARGRPPAHMASARGCALATSSILMTGTMPSSPILFRISFMI